MSNKTWCGFTGEGGCQRFQEEDEIINGPYMDSNLHVDSGERKRR